MRSAGHFHPEWGYLAPAPNFRRTVRVVLVAAAISATAGAVATRALVTSAPPGEFAARVLVRHEPAFISPAAAAPLATNATAAAWSGPRMIDAAEHWRSGCAFCAAFALSQSPDSARWPSPAYADARAELASPVEQPVQRSKSSGRKPPLQVKRNRARLRAFARRNSTGRTVETTILARRRVFAQPDFDPGAGQGRLFAYASPATTGSTWPSAPPAAGARQWGRHSFRPPYRHYSVCAGNRAFGRPECSGRRDGFRGY